MMNKKKEYNADFTDLEKTLFLAKIKNATVAMVFDYKTEKWVPKIYEKDRNNGPK